MIVVDANLLIYAFNPTDTRHRLAASWLRSAVRGEEEVGIPWVSIWAFLRLATNPGIAMGGRPITEAFAAIRTLLASPNVIALNPGPRHTALLHRMADEGQARGKMMTDAVLAAITLEYGGRLATTDRDFTRFPGLAWFNPLSRTNN